jgi:hypothetical protein
MMAELEDTADDIMHAEERGTFPRTPDKSCEWGCDYLSLCVIDLQGGRIDNEIKLKYERRSRNEEEG